MKDFINWIILIFMGIYFLILSNQLTRIERLIRSQQTTEITDERPHNIKANE